MKKLFLFLLPLTIWSCNKGDVTTTGNNDAPSELSEKLIDVAFTALGENVSDADEQTKVHFEDLKAYSYSQLWEVGNEVAVYSGQGTKTVISVSKAYDNGHADFSGQVGESSPYKLIYPFNENQSIDDTTITSTLPVVQTAGEYGTDPAALVSVAYAENLSSVSFYNAFALIQFTLEETDVTSVMIEGANGEKIAGEFTVNANSQTPVATPTENSSTVVVLKPSADTFAPGTYAVAVFPQTFENGFRVIYKKSDTKKCSVKSVKSNIELSRNTARHYSYDKLKPGDYKYYYLLDAEDLITWAKDNANYAATDVVYLMRDIALTEAQANNYVEANDFKGTFNGNDHKISGLKTPLFGNLRGAVVNGVKVEANVTSNGKPAGGIRGQEYGMGLLAHYAYRDGGMATPSISNVETSGSITITGLNMSHNYLVGGMLGSSNNVPLTNCVNKANVLVEDGSVTGILFVGGLTGGTQSGTNVNLTGCSNEGSVKVLDAVSATTECYVGGISGKSTQAVEYKNCSNSGAVRNKMKSSTLLYTGGIVGAFDAAAKLTNCDNSGSVIDSTSFAAAVTHAVGGIIGYAKSSATIVDCDNTGAVTLKTGLAKESYVSGVAGYITGTATINTCTNDGAIEDQSEDATNTNAHLLSGIVSYGKGATTISNCENKSNGTITVKTKTNGSTYAGGIAGYTYTKTDVTSCVNNATITNNSEFTTSKTHYMGGIVAYFRGSAAPKDLSYSNINLNSCTNNGNILNSATASATSQMGGITAGCGSFIKFVGCSNGSATATVQPSVTSDSPASSTCYIGGICGALTKCGYFEDCINYGEVKSSKPVTSYYRVGGICGNSVQAKGDDESGWTQTSWYTNCENYGNIVNDTNSTLEARFGGISGSGSTNKVYVTGCKNFGNIYDTENATTKPTNDICFGGIFGYCGNAGSKFEKCISICTVTQRDASTFTYCGEIVGWFNSSSAWTLKDNKIAGTVNGVAVTADNCKKAGFLFGKKGATDANTTGLATNGYYTE